jgi:hypothetical protein
LWTALRYVERDPLRANLVETVHSPGTGSFFGPFRAEKGACPLPTPGGQSHFRGLRHENRDSPRERLRPPGRWPELVWPQGRRPNKWCGWRASRRAFHGWGDGAPASAGGTRTSGVQCTLDTVSGATCQRGACPMVLPPRTARN